MKNMVSVFLLSLLFSLTSHANEASYFYCTSQTKFAAVKVTQVITHENGSIYSTFKLDVWNLDSHKKEYWQAGNAQMSSDDSFKGTFEKTDEIIIEASIKAPTFPDFKPRRSSITQGLDTYLLDCHTL